MSLFFLFSIEITYYNLERPDSEALPLLVAPHHFPIFRKPLFPLAKNERSSKLPTRNSASHTESDVTIVIFTWFSKKVEWRWFRWTTYRTRTSRNCFLLPSTFFFSNFPFKIGDHMRWGARDCGDETNPALNRSHFMQHPVRRGDLHLVITYRFTICSRCFFPRSHKCVAVSTSTPRITRSSPRPVSVTDVSTDNREEIIGGRLLLFMHHAASALHFLKLEQVNVSQKSNRATAWIKNQSVNG